MPTLTSRQRGALTRARQNAVRVEQRLAETMDLVTSECVVWQWQKDVYGYGRVTVSGRRWPTHRLSWIRANGDIPPGMSVCHKCDNPPCVNPAHLFLGTFHDNMMDRIVKGRTARGDKSGGWKNPPYGERSCTAKLTAAQVIEIRKRRAEGALQPDLAREFGVAQSAISHIVNGKKWRHLLPGWSPNQRPGRAAGAST